MRKIWIIAGAATIWAFSANSIAQTPLSSELDQQMQALLVAHYDHYKDSEYFSGAALSVYIPGQEVRDYYVGKLAHDPKSQAVDGNTLFEIGSITKSFTAEVMLRLDKAGKLKLADSLKKWLPEYARWPEVSITQLLNMTSGFPNYSDTPLFNTQIYYNLSRIWTPEELLGYVYPQSPFFPPLKSGFFYSNTNYILASLIIEKATHDTFAHVLTEQAIDPAGLKQTLYVLGNAPAKILSRRAHGYFYNPYDNPAMVGKDISSGNLSWAGAAGGLMANAHDIVVWVKALFVDNTLLDNAQKRQLMNLVSQQSGQPITQTTPKDPRGFGLGVAQMDDFWFYEGKTLGFRAIYWYKPCNGIILAAVFNSATDDSNDHAGALLQQAYQSIVAQRPQLNCHTDTVVPAEREITSETMEVERPIYRSNPR